MPRITPLSPRVASTTRGAVLSRLPNVGRPRTFVCEPRTASRRPLRVALNVILRENCTVIADDAVSSIEVTDEDDESRSSSTESPRRRTRLSLALDPYSRMALPEPENGEEEVQRRPTSDIFWGAIFCFFTVSTLGILDAFVKTRLNLPFMSGAWGTISILAFGTLENPSTRFYNCVVATTFATFAVALIFSILGSNWFSRALALALSLAFMMWTGSVHPPGAAAVMAFMDQKALQELGFLYSLYPVLFGSLLVLTMGRICALVKRKHEFTVVFGKLEASPNDADETNEKKTAKRDEDHQRAVRPVVYSF